MKLTPKMIQAMSDLKALETSHLYETLWFIRRFGKATLNGLVKRNLVRLVHQSRMREDDREMVYWTAIELVPTNLEKELA
jgi:hypothetical protein